MKRHPLLLLLVLAAIAVSAALNWNAIVTPVELSIGVTKVKMPLGAVMLGFPAFRTGLFLFSWSVLKRQHFLTGGAYAKKFKPKESRNEAAIWDESHVLLNGINIRGLDHVALKDGDRLDLISRIAGG
ncbi:MAG: MoaD/ThiS family protein [Deltaproteobacteria bacterium]|nr:MoaD/ThiS family protein [Deltaproteobacteria bacterium]